MTTPDQLRSKVRVLMFDQYGTVVDMQAGLIEAVTPYLKSKGWSGRPEAFVTWWRRTHFENSSIAANGRSDNGRISPIWSSRISGKSRNN